MRRLLTVLAWSVWLVGMCFLGVAALAGWIFECIDRLAVWMEECP